MLGVPRELAEHTLNIDPKFKPVKQFLRRFNKERRKAIGEEVARVGERSNFKKFPTHTQDHGDA